MDRQKRGKNVRLQPGKYSIWLGEASKLEDELAILQSLVQEILTGNIELEVSFVSSAEKNWIGNITSQTPRASFNPFMLTVYTSGTTGEPKRTQIDLKSRARKVTQRSHRKWLLCYPLGRWASFFLSFCTR
jgi:acyl-coenzyme A synthetase/AMP-(fatty) acid ligase